MMHLHAKHTTTDAWGASDRNETPNRRRVLAVCGDPGGAAAIAPVVKRLQGMRGVDLAAFAYGPGLDVLRASGISCEPIVPSIPGGSCIEIWERFAPDALLCATSVNEFEYEKQFIRIAKDRGAPSLAVIDAWSGYERRFGPCRGVFDALPDRIAVMDERARQEWISACVGEERLVVTGQPAFDSLADERRRFSQKQRQSVRAKLGVVADEWMVTFFSQPIRQLTLEGAARYIYPGYDQYEVFDRLMFVLRGAARERAHPGIVVMRPHPREEAPATADSDAIIRVVTDRATSSRELMLSSDLVAGMASIAIVEACYMGCLTISLQPGALYPEAVASNIAGVSASVRTWAEFDDTLERMLFDEELRAKFAARLAGYRVDGKATERVVRLLLSMMANKQP